MPARASSAHQFLFQVRRDVHWQLAHLPRSAIACPVPCMPSPAHLLRVPMTPAEHWTEADLILSGDPCEYGCPHSGCAHELRLIARAQVHALLALGVVVGREAVSQHPPGTAEPLEFLT